MRASTISVVVSALIFFSMVGEVRGQEFEFTQNYERGRLLLQKRFYKEAVKAFTKAVKTEKGKKHFGAHYYLATAYFWLPDIKKAMEILESAKPLIKGEKHRRAYNKLMAKIKSLYGQIVLVPEVDPDEVGRLQLVLRPKVPFSNRHKRRYYKIMMAKIKKQGGLRITDEPLYLPRGDYEIGIARDQCLSIGLFIEDKIAREISVGDAPISLSVKKKQSCKCPSNQKLFRDGKKLYCACPKGTGWNKEKNRCEVAKKSPLPWILAGAGVVVVGGVAGIIIYEITRDKRLKAVIDKFYLNIQISRK